MFLPTWHENCMEFFTWNTMESPWKILRFSTWNSMRYKTGTPILQIRPFLLSFVHMGSFATDDLPVLTYDATDLRLYLFSGWESLPID